jgi:hypothetical protein
MIDGEKRNVKMSEYIGRGGGLLLVSFVFIKMLFPPVDLNLSLSFFSKNKLINFEIKFKKKIEIFKNYKPILLRIKLLLFMRMQ